MTDPDRILEPDSYDFLVDDSTRDEPIVGLRANPLIGASVVIPMNAETADQVGALLLAHARMFREATHRAVSPAKARMMRYPAATN
jgi:hypothetical protein